MTETASRKGSLSFFNPFKSKSGSRTSSRASSIDFDDPRKGPLATVTLKKTNSSGQSSMAGSTKNSLDYGRPSRHGSLLANGGGDNNNEWERDAQTGERIDHTEMLHGLAHRESAESLADKTQAIFLGVPPRLPSEFFSKFPIVMWERLVDLLEPADKARPRLLLQTAPTIPRHSSVGRFECSRKF